MGNALRKPIQPEGNSAPVVPDAYFPFCHSWLLHLQRISSGRTMDRAILTVMSIANQRSRDGRVTGWTQLLSTETLAMLITGKRSAPKGERPKGKRTHTESPYVTDDDMRDVQRLLQYACDPAHPIFTRLTVAEARKQKVALTDDEKGFAKSNPRAFLLRTDPDQYPKICDYQPPEVVDEEEPEDEEETEEPAAEAPREVVHLTEQPLLVMPGRRGPAPLPVTAAARRSLAKCQAIETRSDIPVRLSLTIQKSGNLLAQIGAAAETLVHDTDKPPVRRSNERNVVPNSEQKAKPKRHGSRFDGAFVENNGTTSEISGLLNPWWRDRFGTTLDADILSQLAGVLKGCPVQSQNGEPSLASVLGESAFYRDRKRKVESPRGLLIHIAKQAAGEWEEYGRTHQADVAQVDAQPPPAPLSFDDEMALAVKRRAERLKGGR